MNSSARREPAFLLRLALVSALSVVAAAGCAHRTTTVQPPAQPPSEAPPSPLGQPPSPPSGAPPAAEQQPATPGEYVEEGVASWYGFPFDGRRTSNGEIYDMNEFTAAHRTLPFGAVVRVTNLANGRETEVRINDRGPFVANRVIDLSHAAAEALEMIGPGTAPVRLTLLSGPNPEIGFFGVQVGAFQNEENAERLQAQLETRYSPVTIAIYDSPYGIFHRVRVGRVPSESDAAALAAQLRSDEHLTTFVIRLDN
ncbi:MAG: septal ring lytic transglycosylase RlpA family protein [Candidatus Acidiferrales bacterium]